MSLCFRQVSSPEFLDMLHIAVCVCCVMCCVMWSGEYTVSSGSPPKVLIEAEMRTGSKVSWCSTPCG